MFGHWDVNLMKQINESTCKRSAKPTSARQGDEALAVACKAPWQMAKGDGSDLLKSRETWGFDMLWCVLIPWTVSIKIGSIESMSLTDHLESFGIFKMQDECQPCAMDPTASFLLRLRHRLSPGQMCLMAAKLCRSRESSVDIVKSTWNRPTWNKGFVLRTGTLCSVLVAFMSLFCPKNMSL